MIDNDYIRREAAIDIALDWCPDDDGSVVKTGDLRDMLDELEAIPAADVRPVKRGHWVKRMEEHTTPKYTSFTPIWSCSECGLEYDPALAPRVHFCYNCGADLREYDHKRED